MKNMNIITIDYKKLQQAINEYLIEHFDKPIILMSKNSINFLQEENSKYIDIDISNVEKNIPALCGCKIATANWIPFGRIELR